MEMRGAELQQSCLAAVVHPSKAPACGKTQAALRAAQYEGPWPAFGIAAPVAARVALVAKAPLVAALVAVAWVALVVQGLAGTVMAQAPLVAAVGTVYRIAPGNLGGRCTDSSSCRWL